jgi:hypothetical protein
MSDIEAIAQIEATARLLHAEFGNLRHHGREGLDAWVVMVGHFTHIGWRPPEPPCSDMHDSLAFCKHCGEFVWPEGETP